MAVNPSPQQEQHRHIDPCVNVSELIEYRQYWFESVFFMLSLHTDIWA